MSVAWDHILRPGQSSDCTDALRELLNDLTRDPATPVPAEVQRHIDQRWADDVAQAAWIGLVQIALRPERRDELGVLARLFPALRMRDEPALQRAAIAAFGDHSPRRVIDRLIDLLADDHPGCDLDRRYALHALAATDIDRLTDDAASYAAR